VYSIVERITLGALSNDIMLAMPVINFVGFEAWKAKEAKEPEERFPQWGAHEERSVLWEVLTATTLLQAGTDSVVLVHPDSIRRVQDYIEELMDGGVPQ
jgi:acetyl-CoA decarbonylase/synthase complex subunit delta